MDIQELKKPVTPIEMSELTNCASWARLPKCQMDILRRMCFQLEQFYEEKAATRPQIDSSE